MGYCCCCYGCLCCCYCCCCCCWCCCFQGVVSGACSLKFSGPLGKTGTFKAVDTVHTKIFVPRVKSSIKVFFYEAYARKNGGLCVRLRVIWVNIKRDLSDFAFCVQM